MLAALGIQVIRPGFAGKRITASVLLAPPVVGFDLTRLPLLSGHPVYHHGMAHPQIPDDITQVTEAELRADLTTFLDCVTFAEEELVVMRDRQPINE